MPKFWVAYQTSSGTTGSVVITADALTEAALRETEAAVAAQLGISQASVSPPPGQARLGFVVITNVFPLEG
jgi:hypothetical protein